MTTLAPERPVETAPKPKRSARDSLPVWLRKPPRRPVRDRRPAPTPREARWWVGVVWLVASTLLVGFVGHVTLVGSLQHAREQHVSYQELRSTLALATTPLGQLDGDAALVATGTPIAYLSIPRLDVAEVVVQGTTPEALMSGPGHRRDTVFPGQEGTSVIMGRQATYGGPFARIGGLRTGDEIVVTTAQGESTYTVFSVRTEGDLLPIPAKEGEGRLELITGAGVPLAPSGTLHVDAELTSEVQDTPAFSFTSAVLDPSESAMAVDSGGWFALFFWLQWLVAAAVATSWVRSRWGVWQTWVIAVPVLFSLGAATAGAAMSLLPNLL